MKETNKARQAFEDYFNLGPGRSLTILHGQYRSRSVSEPSPPSKRLPTLKTWSTVHGWQERVRQRDQEIADATLYRIIETATNTGYAVYQKRIHDLGVLAEKLFDLLMPVLPDGENRTAGALQPQAVREYRGLLADIAAETGGRERKHSVTLGWRNDIVELLKSGKLEPQLVTDDLGEDLATELFIAAGLAIGESGEVSEDSESPRAVA